MVSQEASFVPLENRAESFFIGILGLSGGGPLAAFAASRPGTPFTRVIVINPAWSWNDVMLDFKVKSCQDSDDPSKCITDYIIPITVETPDVVQETGTIGNGMNY